MKDRFSKATSELTDKNPYICDSCEAKYGHPTVEHLGELPRPEIETKSTECILFCDPMPFGD